MKKVLFYKILFLESMIFNQFFYLIKSFLAQETFKNISIAYSVLSDPNKRRQYDVSGPSMAMSDYDGFDVSELGNVGMFNFWLYERIYS